MAKAELNTLIEVLSFPVWVFSTGRASINCDKIVAGAANDGLRRTRYMISGGSQCTCMSYMKHSTCKHLHMLNGDYSWAKAGVSAESAVMVAQRLVEKVGEQFPASVTWVPDIKALPANVECLTINLKDGPKDVERFVYVAGCLDGKLVVVFLFTETEVE